MTGLSITPPFPVFTGLDGDALDGGMIYVGTPNLDPVTNPVPLYWDAALTIPATQPIRTSGGYAVRNGAPSLFYADKAIVSMTIKDAQSVPVFTDLMFVTLGSFIQVGTGAVVRTAQEKMRDRFDLRDFGVIRRQSTSNEYTAVINAALQQAAAENVQTVYCEESYRVAGTIIMPSGLALVSAGGSTTYFDPLNATRPQAGFYKPSDGNNGALLLRNIGDTVIGLTLEHVKVGGATLADGGVMCMGPQVVTNNCNNMMTSRVTLIGHEIDFATGLRRVGTGDCHLMVFGSTPVGTQRYGCVTQGLRLANAFTGIYMGNQCNANTFHGISTNAIWRSIVMNGDLGEVLGNEVQGKFTNNYPLPTTTLTSADVAALPEPARGATQVDIAVITMRQRVQLNKITGYSECGGRILDVDAIAPTFFNDISDTLFNEVYPVDLPELWALPSNYFGPNRRRGDGAAWTPFDASYAPTAATRLTQGQSNRFEQRRVWTTGTPLLNGAGITTGAASKRFARFTVPAVVSKAAEPTIEGRLRVEVDAQIGTLGVHLTEVEFSYRVTDKATGAGSFAVRRVIQEPAVGNYLTALSFLTGVTGGIGFGFAATCGGVGATPVLQLTAGLDAEVAVTNGSFADFNDMGAIDWTLAAVTANDVTDAISMLTVAATAV